MHVCGQCSAPLEPDSRFCGQCGAELTGSQAPTLAGPPPDAPPTDPFIGREVIGQYVITHKLGAGGMGAVYVADQPSMGRTAVIKVLHPWLSSDPEIARRFDNEAHAVARLSDPHIIQLFNYGDMGDGTLFLAMEHLDGRTLSQVLKAEGPLPVARAVDVTLQVCEALTEAHRHGVVHRDLKPSNIMLLDRPGGERVKVLDFGVAKLQGSSQTSTDQPVGTPRYMSPEQLAGRQVDGRSDLYALGLVMYEMLTGAPPFLADTPVAYVHMHMAEAPAPMGGSIPPAIEGVVMAALSKQPEDRPDNAAALADMLRAAMRTPAPAHTGEAAPRQGSLKPVVGGLVAFVVLAALGGTYWLVSREARQGKGRDDPSLSSATPATSPPTPAVVPTADTGATPDAPVPPALDEPTMDPDEPTTGPDAPPAADTAGPGPTPTPTPTPKVPRPPRLPKEPTVPTATDGGPGGSPLPPLSPEAKRLLKLSVSELEKKFFTLLKNAHIPPSSKQQVTDSYGMFARSLAPGPEAEKQRKTYLVQLIIGYRNMPEHPPGFHLPIKRLEKILMGLDHATTPAQRKETYDGMVKSFNETAKTKADREYWRRYAVVSLIQTFSGDKEYLRKHQ